jgi:hypothetical protein
MIRRPIHLRSTSKRSPTGSQTTRIRWGKNTRLPAGRLLRLRSGDLCFRLRSRLRLTGHRMERCGRGGIPGSYPAFRDGTRCDPPHGNPCRSRTNRRPALPASSPSKGRWGLQQTRADTGHTSQRTTPTRCRACHGGRRHWPDRRRQGRWLRETSPCRPRRRGSCRRSWPEGTTVRSRRRYRREGKKNAHHDRNTPILRDFLRGAEKPGVEGRGYLPPFAGSKNLRDTESGVRIEFLVAGDYPGTAFLVAGGLPRDG